MPITVVVRSASPAERSEAAARPPSLTFDGPRVVIGRSAGCDVRLPDPSVSLRHASIRASGSDYAIVDEGSTNGTFLGGVQLLPQTPRMLKSGDLLRVGRVWLEVAIGQRPATPDLGLATRDFALALVRDAMAAVGDDTIAKVLVLEGPDSGSTLRLVDEGRAYVIGRAEQCDLPLADTDASREHALVVRRGSQILLRDAQSHNGVMLGDQMLIPDRDTIWRAPTMARIGHSVLAVEEPVSIALAALEAAADEEIPEGAEPPPPKSQEAPAVSSTSRGADGVAAPIVELARAEPPPAAARPKGRAWTVTDLIVVTVALAVIGASVAGLIWVLR
jgi:pSer/pThr/pTyr-binding forkhead associated (FHA) protein